MGSRSVGLAAALACAWGCGSAASTDGSGGGGADSAHAGATSKGGTSVLAGGGGGAAGTRDDGGGAGTTAAAGTNGAGSAGAPPTGRCRSVADCPILTGPTVFGTQCLGPDQPTPAGGCGAPGWCGECNCPAQPEAPSGTGAACQTSVDCPASSASVAAASICDHNQCTACASDNDCPESSPVCGSVGGRFGALFRACTGCRTDEQCAGATPHCQVEVGLGRCVACISSQECNQGVCSQGSCVPQCDASRPCADPFSACAASQRCEAVACANDAECSMPNARCATGHCARRTCATDGECDDGGSCVNGRCYETLGRCYTDLAVP